METPSDRRLLQDNDRAPSLAPDRTEDARRVVADYIRDQKEILETLRRLFS